MLACLLQTAHQDAIASLEAGLQEAKEAHEALQQQLAAQQEAAAQQQEQLEALQTTLVDLQAQLGECIAGCTPYVWHAGRLYSPACCILNHASPCPQLMCKPTAGCETDYSHCPCVLCLLPCCCSFVGAGESQACAAAAKERIEVLEQEAETAATEHQQAVDAAAETFKAAQEAAAQQLQEAQEAATAQLQQANDQREAEISKVQAELAAVKVRCDRSRHS
jgi:uncharacterized coiled-coil protein SlyX